MLRITEYIISCVCVMYGTGVLFAEQDVTIGLVSVAIGNIILPISDETKNLFPKTSEWVFRLFNAIPSVIFSYVIWINNKPIDTIKIDSKIKDVITYETERTIALIDVGLGYSLWIFIYVCVFVLYSYIIIKITRLINKLFWRALTFLSDKNLVSVKTDLFIFNHTNGIQKILFIFYSLLFILCIYLSYMSVIKALNVFIFASSAPIKIYSISIVISRLSNFFISVGAAPSFARIWSVFVTITSVWASFEGASNMFKALKNLSQKPVVKSTENN